LGHTGSVSILKYLVHDDSNTHFRAVSDIRFKA